MNQPAIFTKVEYWDVDYFELEKFIIEQYGLKDFDFVQVVETKNNSEHSYEVNKEQTPQMLKSIADCISNLKAGYVHGVYMPYIFYDLCNRDVIQSGNYLVRVNW